LQIVAAWSDEPWINDGAAVRVSLVAFGRKRYAGNLMLDGQWVKTIHTDLSASTCEGVELNPRPLIRLWP